MRGYYQDKEDIVGRLKRIEGQVRGLQRLVQDDTYCVDILTQISAATSGLRRVAVRLLDDHIRNCVAESLAGGADAQSSISEATAAVDRLLRS